MGHKQRIKREFVLRDRSFIMLESKDNKGQLFVSLYAYNQNNSQWLSNDGKPQSKIILTP